MFTVPGGGRVKWSSFRVRENSPSGKSGPPIGFVNVQPRHKKYSAQPVLAERIGTDPGQFWLRPDGDRASADVDLALMFIAAYPPSMPDDEKTCMLRRGMAVPPQSVEQVLWRALAARGPRDRGY